MNPVPHSSNNLILGAPKDPDAELKELKVDPLPITRTTVQGVMSNASFWQPNEEEISRILAGMPITVFVIGPAFYPLAVGVADTFQS